ncbi:DUF4232 domain-containing protein [Umezawaea tangerina]|uniref:Uncharacterized protein DUF4232 n=1 Tax=Umezawaea tangerina TaxID=84725 RepID=A0A2T0T166_9PSEU|nr:DUF4232 domain-containing protein [Umezawaea tangerina]PRY39418.1 uncharacterized protein DUF4232 [Umezawaea tangerina]
MGKNSSRVVRGAAVVVLAAFGALTACSAGETGGSAGGDDVTPSSSTVKQTQTSASASAGGSDALRDNGDKPPSGEPLCATAKVSLGLEFPVQGVEGQLSVPVLLANSSAARCTIQGFPGVQFQTINGDPWDLGRGDDPIKPVSLAPGESTSATLVFLSAGTREGTSHWTPDSVLVTPPNTTDTQRLTWDFGAILRQDTATRPGTFVRAVDAVDYGNR